MADNRMRAENRMQIRTTGLEGASDQQTSIKIKKSIKIKVSSLHHPNGSRNLIFPNGL